MVTQAIGKALYGGLKIGAGFAMGVGTGALAGSALLGKGLFGASKVIGKRAWGASTAVGKTLISPVETAENRARTANNYINVVSNLGKTFIHKNKDGEFRLTKRGIAILGGITAATKAEDSWFDAKATNLGTIDQKPTTATPNYNPVQYEMSPPKRIYPDSGGATGDLVFALHRLR